MLALIAYWGLWKSKAWGWWLALVMDSVGLVMFLCDPGRRRVWPDADELVFIILFVVLLGLLLLAPVRRSFLGKKGKTT